MVVSEERMAALEARTARLEARMSRIDPRLAGAPEAAPEAPIAPEPLVEPPVAPKRAVPPMRKARVAPTRVAAPPLVGSSTRIEDLVGGRVLGWVGGIAILVGLLFFLVIAASRGWLGEEARVLLAAVASLSLAAAAAWLHERRGRTEAALAGAATGIAGLFATTVVAGPVYDLLPSSAALVLALLVGAAATGLALRWKAPGIGWLGIAGALLSPALVGATADGTGIALMLVAYAAAGAVMIWQRWHALAGVAFAIGLPQLAWWLTDGAAASIVRDGAAPVAAIAAAAVFGTVTAIGAIGFEWRTRAADVRISALVLLALNALALAWLGSLALGETGTSLWFAALAIVHVGAGLAVRRGARVSRELALTLSSLGIVLADVAFASVADGLPLVLGWAAGGVGFAVLARAARHRADEAVALSGLGGHLLLAVALAMMDAAGTLADETAVVTAALAAAAAGAWAAARIIAPRLPDFRLVLDAVALGAIAMLSAYALDGIALTLTLAGEAVALAALAIGDRARALRRTASPAGPAGAAASDDRAASPAGPTGAAASDDRAASHSGPTGAAADVREPDPLPFPAAVVFLVLALADAIVVIAPPSVLVSGLDAVLPEVVALVAVAVAAALVARAATGATHRLALGGLAATVGLYLVSALVVTPFQPGGDATGLPLDQLDIRQQGQALLSAVWALAGVGALLLGLVRDNRTLRLAALALLTLTVGKVFLFDLASLTSLYRVGSCIALGLLLLVGAFAWQRIRPRTLPDLREVPGALR